MKTIYLSTTACLSVMLAARAVAIEAPSDNSPPPPINGAPAAEVAPPPAFQAAKPEILAETAYLGVVTSDIPEMLAAHLSIKPGDGVIVTAVMPGGPAENAGIVVHDIITRVGDRQTGSPDALSRQVTALKPGDSVRLNLIHEGNPVERDTTLGIRPAQVAALGHRPLDQLNLEGIPDELAERVREMIQGNLGGLEMHFGEGGKLEALPQVNELMRGMQERMEKALGEMAAPDAKPNNNGPNLDQGATIRIMDNLGCIELKSIHGGKEVTIRDKENNVSWSGPWDTEQDKAAAPDDVRQRVDKLNLDTKFQGNGLRLHNLPNQGGE